MNKETLAVVEALAKHLNTTAEHLWGVLVAQAGITAITDGVLLVAMWGVIITYLLHFNKLSKLWNDADTAGSILFVVGGAVSVILALCQFATLSELLTCLLNPEYWALQQILKAL